MEKIKFLIFDFDHTISAYHLHSECLKILSFLPQFKHEQITMDKLQTWDTDMLQEVWEELKLTQRLVPTGSAQEWRSIFKTLIDHEYNVSIASFSSFEPIIRRFLKEVIELPESYLAKIHIEAWLPYNQQNKNLHLDRILSGQGSPTLINWQEQTLNDEKRRVLYQKLILIDDTLANVDAIFKLVGPRHAIIVPHKAAIIPTIIMDTLSERLQLEFYP